MVGCESFLCRRREVISRRSLYWASVALLGLSVLYQGLISWDGYMKPELQRVRGIWSLPAWERTAILLEGQHFLEYVRFLRRIVPEDGRVILPPRQLPSAFSNIYYAQYYLFPRDLHNCGNNEVEACIERVTGSNTYIVALGNFPPRGIAARHKIYVPFDDEIGVFVPPGTVDN